MANNSNNNAKVTPRGVATGFLVICILFSMFILGGGKMASLRDGVTTLIDGGEESVITDMKKHNDNAYNIIIVARRVLGEDDDILVAAESAYEAANRETTNANSPKALSAADDALDSAILALVGKLNDSNMSDKDTRLVRGEHTTMRSYDDIMAHTIDEYNQSVSDYANEIGGFPGGLIAAVRGLGAPEYFR